MMGLLKDLRAKQLMVFATVTEIDGKGCIGAIRCGILVLCTVYA